MDEDEAAALGGGWEPAGGYSLNRTFSMQPAFPRFRRRMPGTHARAALVADAVAAAEVVLVAVNVMADHNHREPPWVLFLSGDEEAKPVVAPPIGASRRRIEHCSPAMVGN